ncbi:ABC transporter permease [Micromonospora sp. RTGN7]|uniref:ABC transporter permease n=1 Tax=Micromonospora sp. RTGN7 TaxID=3016526 RepID=UPI0029FEF22E|nr:ABC transporter permease [Micromonospora sp. RTGN7]
MTAPTINGTRYPQPVDALLPAARDLSLPAGQQFPSRNRLMREFHIGAAKADDLRSRLVAEAEAARERPSIDETRTYNLIRGGTGGMTAADLADAARRVAADPTASDYMRSTARDVLADAAPDPVPTSVVPESAPPAEPDPTPAPEITPAEADGQATTVRYPDTPAPTDPPARPRAAVVWPVVLLALPAFVAIWGGWVGLGKLTGFGKVNLLPGIGSGWVIDTAITLPIGVETYGAFALYVWLSGRVPAPAARFAKWSALGSLAIGALGQVAYHLLIAAGIISAPWWITTLVACLPVAVLGMGAALAHLMHAHD